MLSLLFSDERESERRQQNSPQACTVCMAATLLDLSGLLLATSCVLFARLQELMGDAVLDVGASPVAGPSRLPTDDSGLPPYTPTASCLECAGRLRGDYSMPPDCAILVPPADSKSNVSDSTSAYMPICRICHESAIFENLISPCRCAGSLGFIHNTCLMVSNSNLQSAIVNTRKGAHR